MTDRHVTNEPTPFAMVPEALLYDPERSDKAVRLYGVLRRHGDDPTDCYPSKRRLADLMGCAPASLNRPLNELEDAGWIVRVARVDDRGQTSNGYHVHAAPRTSSAPRSQVSDGAHGSAARTPIAQEPRERQPVNDSPGTREPRVSAAPLALVAQDEPGPTFDAFWKVYPRGDGKPAAIKAWDKALKAATPERIMAGLDAWLRYWRARQEPEFVPWAQKWLNQQQWFADPPPLRRADPGPRGPITSSREGQAGRVVDL